MSHWRFPGWKLLAIGCGVGFITPGLALGAGLLTGWRVEELLTPGPRVVFWIVLASAPVMAPLEEWVFRGVLLRWLRPKVGSVGALLISSTAFALVHGVNKAVPMVLVGLMFGLLYLWTRSLWPSIAAHIVHILVMLTVSAAL